VQPLRQPALKREAANPLKGQRGRSPEPGDGPPPLNWTGAPPLKFAKLRLTGFKLFVEPTELPIEPGLTGIVGPNGCGKSNLLEALRWVMGENSAKSMRGGAMDDVDLRRNQCAPSRNMAEVALFIDNATRSAPAHYNDADVLEISRRIERDMGSIYKINGRDVRARDVQIFFADASSGHTRLPLSAQGQIGQLINAKPIARRSILEEAAGIAGLHRAAATRPNSSSMARSRTCHGLATSFRRSTSSLAT
jgi:chromosome segregation ATPase